MRSFAARLVAWHDRHGRHDLPWQQSRDPYRVWLSEIMLQQTQVATVIPYYRRFLERFPDLPRLAAASTEEVMAAWSGLGYYARARNLHACARTVAAGPGGRFPSDPAAIAALPGIGPSTANAIAVFCFGARLPILDGNVKRLLCRHRGIEGFPGIPAVERDLWTIAGALLPRQRVDSYIQAQMDLGATLCSRGRPRCTDCPVAEDCVAHRTGRTSELPAARPRKALPEKPLDLLVPIHDDRVLLELRPPAGIWGGLLSLPERTAGVDTAEALARLGCRLLEESPLEPLEHTLSHFRLRLQPRLCRVAPLPRAADDDRWRWLGAADLADAPLPAPIRRLLVDLLSPPEDPPRR